MVHNPILLADKHYILTFTHLVVADWAVSLLSYSNSDLAWCLPTINPVVHDQLALIEELL